MKLYEYASVIDDLFALSVDEETGEVIENQFFERLNEVQMEFDEFVLHLGHKVLNEEAEEKICKEQKEKFAAREKAAKNRKESLKRYLAHCLDGNTWDKAPDKSVKITFRKSEQVNILDEALIPAEYIKTKIETSVDKTELKKAIKDGLVCEGAEIETKQNIQIK